VFLVYFEGSGLFDELIARVGESYRVCVCVCPIVCDNSQIEAAHALRWLARRIRHAFVNPLFTTGHSVLSAQPQKAEHAGRVATYSYHWG